MRSVKKLTETRKFPLIYRGLVKIYGKEQVKKILYLSECFFEEAICKCKDATRGEWIHLEETILPMLAVYQALLQEDRKNALLNIEKIMMQISAIGGKIIRTLLYIPGMSLFFMWYMPRVAFSLFGESCGFEQEMVQCNNRRIKFNIYQCPYHKYSVYLGCPELTYIFCKSDNAVYGNLNKIDFCRTQTLGMGGSVCDFEFVRK